MRRVLQLVAGVWLLTSAGAAGQIKWTLTADGPTSEQLYRAGGAAIQFAGAFDEASVTIEASAIRDVWAKLFCLFDGGAEQETVDAVTQPGWCRLAVPAGLLRLNVNGAGESTEITAVVVELPRVAIALLMPGGSGGGGPVNFADLLGGELLDQTLDIGPGTVLASTGGQIEADTASTADGLSAGALDTTTDLQGGFCGGPGKILEDQGSDWQCIPTPVDTDGGPTAFSNITAATSTAILVIGPSGSLSTAGSGQINATGMTAGGLSGAITAPGTVVNLDPGGIGGVNFNFSESHFTMGASPMSGTSGVGAYSVGSDLYLTNAGPVGWRVRFESNRIVPRTGSGAPNILLDPGSATVPVYSVDGDTDSGFGWGTGNPVISDEASEIARFVFSTTPRLVVKGVFAWDTAYSAAPSAPPRSLVVTNANDLCITFDGVAWTSVFDETACTF